MLRRSALVVVAVLAGCKAITVGCTLIGCEGALTIAFTTPPTGPYHVEVLSVELGAREYDCAAGASCMSVVLAGYTPDRLVLTISDARGSRQYNVAPDYASRYANGPHCGVTCRSATVTVAMP